MPSPSIIGDLINNAYGRARKAFSERSLAENTEMLCCRFSDT